MSELLQLAKLAKDAYARREASWVPGRGANHYGQYGLSIYEAIEQSLEALQLGESFRVPAELLLHWPNDSLEWADKLIARFEADDTPENKLTYSIDEKAVLSAGGELSK